MAQRTKQRIQETFILLLEQESLDKITVKDLVDRCGMNRNTFYYYYQDLYALLEELLQQELENIIQTHNSFDSWQEGFLEGITFAVRNRRAVFHVFNSGAREHVVCYLLGVADFILTDYVQMVAEGLPDRPEDRRIVVNFYKHALAGVVTDWLQGGMKEDLAAAIRRIGVLMDGNIRRALENGVTER